MRNLRDYHYTQEELENVEFDQYGRPYVQHEKGRLMLSRRNGNNN